MKFKVKVSSVFLSDDSMVREGIIECDGKKADMLKELAEKRPMSVEIVGGSEKKEVPKFEKKDEEPKKEFKKKLRK